MTSTHPTPQPTAGPFRHLHDARRFLRWLVGVEPWYGELLAGVEVEALAEWVVAVGVGPLVYGRLSRGLSQGQGQGAPDGSGLARDLAGRLRGDAFAAAAENSLHFARLRQVLGVLKEEGIAAVVLKGAALAGTAYEEPNWRTMSDVDLWIRPRDLETAVRALHAAGFRIVNKEDRPLHLQLLSDGEVQLLDEHGRLVELHGGPLAGWWLEHTAALDVDGMWQRAVAYDLAAVGGAPGSVGDDHSPVRRLAAEDNVIQVAVHMAVNHQFGMSGVRSLLDVALVAQAEAVDWTVVAQRARAWRVGTAVWLALDLLQTLFGVPVDEALALLQPGGGRRRLLQRLVTPEATLRGKDLRGGPARYLLLLLLVDRRRDAARLLYRTLWPEPAWVAARYGEGVGRWGHLWRVVRGRGV